MAAGDNAIQPSLDTGMFKSAWTWFWIGPFTLFAICAFLAVCAGIIRDGYHFDWGPFIGLNLTVGFSILLAWIWQRGTSREQVWITQDAIRIRRTWILGLGQRERLFERKDIAFFVVSRAATSFDIRVVTKDEESLLLVASHRIKECEDWKRLLASVAPVR